MAQLTVKVNREVLEETISEIIGRNPRYLLQPAREIAAEGFDDIKRRTLNYFDKHPVTEELLAGPKEDGEILPIGNLFSFLGFQADAKPINNLRTILTNGIKVDIFNYRYDRRLKRYYFPVVRPDREEIVDATADDLEWGAFDSWVFAIEDGISNLSHYLFLHNVTLSHSRSGPAIQKKQTINPGLEFGGVDYLEDVWKFLSRELSNPIL